MSVVLYFVHGCRAAADAAALGAGIGKQAEGLVDRFANAEVIKQTNPSQVQPCSSKRSLKAQCESSGNMPSTRYGVFAANEACAAVSWYSSIIVAFLFGAVS